MDIKELEKYRNALEKDYDNIETQIKELEDKENKMEELQKLLSRQDAIDEQLDLLEDVITGYYDVPNKYLKFVELHKKYEQNGE